MQRRTAGQRLGAILFTDIVGSTAIAAEMGNTRWIELVARHHRIVRRQIGRFGGREIDTAGDGFFVTFERPADAIRCAVATSEEVRDLGIEIRAGVSFGELEVAGRKLGGLVVNTASRVMSVGGPGEVLVPSSVREIVSGGGFTFAEHGVHRLKGFDEEFRLFSVTGVDGAVVAPPQDAELAAERRREIFPARARRTALIAGLGAGVLAIGAVAWLVLGGDHDQPRTPPGPLRHSVVRIDPESGRILSTIFVGAAGQAEDTLRFVGHPLVAGEGGVWVLRPPLLFHIDPLHGDIRPGGTEVGLAMQTAAVGFDAVWVLADRTLYRVHPGTDEIEPFLVLPLAPGIATYALALGDHLWVADSDGTLVRMDPATEARDQAETDLSVGGMTTTRNALWVADIFSGELISVDPESLRKVGAPVPIAGSVDQIVGLEDDLWILDQRAGTVTRLDTISRQVGLPVRVGDDPSDMGVGLGAVWVADHGGSLYRVDAVTLDVREYPIGADVLAVAVDDAATTLWVYVGMSTDAASASQPGGEVA
jgi:class 3 adenylate cyclase/streptogramin lyase